MRRGVTDRQERAGKKVWGRCRDGAEGFSCVGVLLFTTFAHSRSVRAEIAPIHGLRHPNAAAAGAATYFLLAPRRSTMTEPSMVMPT